MSEEKKSPYLKALIDMLIAKAIPKVAGFQGWLIAKVMTYGGQLLVDGINKLLKYFGRSKKQNEAKKGYDNKQKDPKSTPRERDEEYEKYINS